MNNYIPISIISISYLLGKYFLSSITKNKYYTNIFIYYKYFNVYLNALHFSYVSEDFTRINAIFIVLKIPIQIREYIQQLKKYFI